MTATDNPSPAFNAQPFAWYWIDEHGCLYITGDDRKPDVQAEAKPLYEHPAPAPALPVTMAKPRISTVAVKAAFEVMDRFEIPDGYYDLPDDDRRRVKEGCVRQALIAAHMADQSTPAPSTHLRGSFAHITVADALKVDKDALAKVTGIDVEESLSTTVAEDVRPSLDIVVRFSELIREVELRRISVGSCVAAIMNLHLTSSDYVASASHGSSLSSSATRGEAMNHWDKPDRPGLWRPNSSVLVDQIDGLLPTTESSAK